MGSSQRLREQLPVIAMVIDDEDEDEEEEAEVVEAVRGATEGGDPPGGGAHALSQENGARAPEGSAPAADRSSAPPPRMESPDPDPDPEPGFMRKLSWYAKFAIHEEPSRESSTLSEPRLPSTDAPPGPHQPPPPKAAPARPPSPAAGARDSAAAPEPGPDPGEAASLASLEAWLQKDEAVARFVHHLALVRPVAFGGPHAALLLQHGHAVLERTLSDTLTRHGSAGVMDDGAGEADAGAVSVRVHGYFRALEQDVAAAARHCGGARAVPYELWHNLLVSAQGLCQCLVPEAEVYQSLIRIASVKA